MSVPPFPDIPLQASGTVTGIVKSAAGNPVGGASVAVTPSGRSINRLRVTDGRGRYTVAHVTLGTVSV